jgi:hypothetical protein
MKNPPAFPQTKDWDDAYAYLWGMTLRDYFAAKAMQALIAGAYTDAYTDSETHKEMDYDVRAFCSYKQADAMLAQRRK